MCPMVNTDDLCDAHEVAALMSLGHPNSVYGYLRRYDDMPRPVFSLGRNRPQLWLRPEVEAWIGRRGNRRPATAAAVERRRGART
jgi:predicted DNA-binding transcriptional regulator AlpA